MNAHNLAHALLDNGCHTWSTARLSLTSFRCGHAGMPLRRHTRLSVEAHTPSRCAASPRLRRKCACTCVHPALCRHGELDLPRSNRDAIAVACRFS